MEKRTALKTGLTSLVTGIILATTSCGGSSTPTPTIANNPTSISDIIGIDYDSNKPSTQLVNYNGDNAVLKFKIADADGYDLTKLSFEAPNDDSINLVRDGEYITVTMNPSQYNNESGEKTAYITGTDEQNNLINKELTFNVYANETQTDEWGKEIIDAKKPNPIQAAGYNQIIGSDELDIFTQNNNGSMDYIRIIGNSADQNKGGLLPTDYILTPVHTKSELEYKINTEVDFTD